MTRVERSLMARITGIDDAIRVIRDRGWPRAITRQFGGTPTGCSMMSYKDIVGCTFQGPFINGYRKIEGGLQVFFTPAGHFMGDFFA